MKNIFLVCSGSGLEFIWNLVLMIIVMFFGINWSGGKIWKFKILF